MNWHRLILSLITASALALMPIAASASSGVSGTGHYMGREYILYSPSRVDARTPLVIVLHGGGGGAAWMQRHFDLSDVADRYNFKIAYLNGTPSDNHPYIQNLRTWNAGDCCGPAVADNAPDEAYISRFIDAMVRQGTADPRRVYLIGHSNGAMMTYRMACTHSDQIAAAIVVSGSVTYDDHCDAARLPILHVHGLDDENVPVKGGPGKTKITGNLVFWSVPQSVSYMRQHGALETVTLLPNTPHDLQVISQNMLAQTGKSLEDTAGAYFYDKSKGLR